MTKRTSRTIRLLLATMTISVSTYMATFAQTIEQSTLTGRASLKQNDRTMSVTAAPSSPAASKLSVSVTYATCDGCAGSPALPGTDITYDIKYQNDGCGDTNATWNTAVPAGTTFVSASVFSNPGDWKVTAAPGVGGGGGVSWAGSVGGDKSVVVRLTVKITTTVPNGFIVSMNASYKANTGDDSFLCGLGGVTVGGSIGSNLTVKVDQPVDETHKLIPPIYQGVIDSLEAINNISATLQATNNNINSLTSNVNNLRTDITGNFVALNSNLNTRFASLDGGINAVGNLVTLHFNTLADNINARFGSLQNTANTINATAAQTLDAVNNIRGTTASIVSQLNVLQASANATTNKLDVVNNKTDTALGKIDAATAKVDALQNTANILNSKLEDVLAKLAAAQANALQFQIETALVEGDRYNIASLQMPKSAGGNLEEVRNVVAGVIDMCVRSGAPNVYAIEQAKGELAAGDNYFSAKGYKDAYEHYRAAYLQLSIVTGARRP